MITRAKKLGATIPFGPEDIPDVGCFRVLPDPTGAALAILKPLTTDRQGELRERAAIGRSSCRHGDRSERNRIDDQGTARSDHLERGVEFVEDPTDYGTLRIATLKDPEGNLIQLLQPLRS